MPRHSSYPTLYDECKTISISDLLKCGYLEQLSSKSGIITWTRGDTPTGSISIAPIPKEFMKARRKNRGVAKGI